MFRKMFSAAAIVSVVVAGLSFSPRVQACPVDMPETLLSLYKSSSEIHLANFVKAEDVGVESESDGYSRVSVKRSFDISTTLKGDTRKMFETNDIEYRYQPPADAAVKEEAKDSDRPEDESPRGEAAEGESEGEKPMAAGDTVVLFLAERGSEEDEDSVEDQKRKKKDGEKEVRLVNLADGVRHIDAGDAAVYESLIKELNSIFSGREKGRDAQIAEWLIRSLEHPATRWDGARELDLSFDSLDRVAAAEEYEKTRKEEGEKADSDDDEEKPWVEESDGESAAIAKALTQSQKDRISNILLTQDENATSATIRDGDAMLLRVVQRWGGPDVAEVLIQKLGNAQLESYEASSLMASISSLLKDDELMKAAEAYREIAWEDDDDDFEEKTDADTSDGVEAEAKPVRKIGEVKAERLAGFIVMARSVVTRPEAQVAAADNAKEIRR